MRTVRGWLHRRLRGLCKPLRTLHVIWEIHISDGKPLSYGFMVCFPPIVGFEHRKYDLAFIGILWLQCGGDSWAGRPVQVVQVI